MMHKTLSQALIFGAAVVLAPPAAAGLLDSITGALNPQAAEETTRLDRLRAAGPAAGACGGDGRTSYLNAQVEQGLGVVQDPALHAYLDGIAGKLVAASPMPGCRVKVYVTPHDAAQAVALADGGILVAIGFLRNLKNEDEVAAVLAHELSHILYNHHSSDAFVDTQDSFLKGLDTANAAGSLLVGVVDPQLAAGLDAAASLGGAMYQISESMIAPAWTSDQEDEADLTGIDLLVAAGYNPRAMASIMEVIGAQEAAAAKVDAEREKLHQQQMQQGVVEAAAKTDFNNPLSILSSAAKLTTTVVSGVDTKSHRPAAERMTQANGYIKQFHNKERRRAFSTEQWEAALTDGETGATFDHYTQASEARRSIYASEDLNKVSDKVKASVSGRFSGHAYPRLVYSEVRLKQGDRTKAKQNLEIALKDPEAPWQIYRSYAELQMLTADYKGATATVDAADAKFGQPLGIAPFAIKVHRSAANQFGVDAYLARCRTAGKREHVKVCEAAAGVQKTEPSGSNNAPGFRLPGFGGSGGAFSFGGSKN